MSRYRGGYGMGGSPFYPGQYQDAAVAGMGMGRDAAYQNNPNAFSNQQMGQFEMNLGAPLGQMGAMQGQNAQASMAQRAQQNQMALSGYAPLGMQQFGASTGGTPNDPYTYRAYRDTSGNIKGFLPYEEQFKQKKELLGMLAGLLGGSLGGLGGAGLQGFASNTGQAAFLPTAFPAGQLQPYPFASMT